MLFVIIPHTREKYFYFYKILPIPHFSPSTDAPPLCTDTLRHVFPAIIRSFRDCRILASYPQQGIGNLPASA